MQYYTDGPTPLPLQPGIVVLDPAQTLADCIMTALLIEAWLALAERPALSYQDPGERHATE